MDTVRAKLSCNAVTLRSSSRTKPGLVWQDGKYVDPDGNEVPRDQISEPWEQPTIILNAVHSSDNPEDNSFAAATPQATFELTITNPDAAEFFELGKRYYADFTRVDG